MTAMVSERRSSRVVSERISAIRPSKYYGMSKDKLKEPGALDQRRQTVKDAMSPHNTREEFRRLLKTENIDAIFRINPIGRIYGVTFIDHNAGIVANGSVLGKEFSANVFNDLYPAPKEVRQPAMDRELLHERQQSHSTNPVSGLVDAVLDLADARAYEEQQKIQRQKRRRRCRQFKP